MRFDVIADLPGSPIGIYDPCKVKMMPGEGEFFYGVYQARIIFRRAIQVARDKIGFHEVRLANLPDLFDCKAGQLIGLRGTSARQAAERSRSAPKGTKRHQSAPKREFFADDVLMDRDSISAVFAVPGTELS